MSFYALAAPPAQCIIEPDIRGARTILTAAASGIPDGGLYQFEITTAAPDGSMSTNIQSSEIQAGQSGRQVLGMVAITVEKSHWTARLKLYSADGTHLCSAQLP